eukprot:g687.t1
MGKGRKKKHAAPRFVANAAELANRSNAFAKEDQNRRARRKAAGCDDSDDESGGEGAGGFMGMAADDARRRMEELRMEGGDEDDGEEVFMKKAKPKGIAEIIGLETNNANSRKKKNTLSKADAASGNFQKATLSRREREIFEKEAADRALMKATAAGETAQAKKDMARLAEMKKRREAKKAKRLAKEKAAQEAAKEQERLAAEAAQGGGDDSGDEDDIPTKIEIKKMKPSAVKERLKKKKLSTQGSKKVIIERLLKAYGY